jgi:flagellin
MAVINTNTKALFSQNALKISAREQTRAMEQLSTGKRINKAGDDAAGLAIATRMTQQIRSLNQAVRNAGDAIALIQTAEGATNEITDMLQRMRELAIQAINDTNNNEQRSYLDLEFQQLKKEIVRVSEMTEWNGFKILDGSTGVPVGERPVYKATATDAHETVFISPTTAREVGGQDGGPIQDLSFTAATTAGTLNIFGVDVSIAVGAASAVATAVYTALLNDDAFGDSSGRTLTDNGDGTIRISYGVEETTVDSPAPSAMTTSVSATATSFNAIDLSYDGTESFAANGEFLLAGSLAFDVPTSLDGSSATVTATFTTVRGDEITMTGTLENDGSAGSTVVFAASGSNAEVISTQLTYSFLDSTGSPINVGAAGGTTASANARVFSVEVDIEGSLPPLRSQDLYINGVNIGQSSADDDTVSPPNNAAGSAIALAAAINRKTTDTGVAAVVNKNIMGGTAMSAGAAVSGFAVINGYTTPEISTVLNDTRASREAVVTAINFISHLTGVKAIDTGVDAEGIRLEAADGRNIEVQFSDLETTSAIFQERTGLKPGVQGGTYSLESRVEAPIVITTSATGDITRARLPLGDFSENVSRFVMAERDVILTSGTSTPVALNSGDLRINGIDIPASRAADDEYSYETSASSRAASSISIAAAINRVSEQTGVRAEVYGAKVTGESVTTASSAEASLFLNGIEIEIDFDDLDEADERVDEIVRLVNLQTGAHGVQASKTGLGGLELVTVDGRNLSVWHSTSVNSSEFGLGDITPENGVTSIASASAGMTAVNSVYGRITLVSEKAFTVEPGVLGYESDSNFTALGFQEGTFGGEVDEATTKMTPPRTGRLSFQVGAAAGQTITIDLADFGHRGPVTSEITRDVKDATATIGISTRSGAESVLSNLDLVMDRVNAKRADMGAVMNRLQYAMDNLSNASMNQAASRSQIEDADYAAASTEMAKAQIMQQAATAVLAQANMSQQTVLQLLQG